RVKPFQSSASFAESAWSASTLKKMSVDTMPSMGGSVAAAPRANAKTRPWKLTAATSRKDIRELLSINKPYNVHTRDPITWDHIRVGSEIPMCLIGIALLQHTGSIVGLTFGVQ